MQFNRDLNEDEKDTRRGDQSVNPIREPKRRVETV